MIKIFYYQFFSNFWINLKSCDIDKLYLLLGKLLFPPEKQQWLHALNSFAHLTKSAQGHKIFATAECRKDENLYISSYTYSIVGDAKYIAWILCWYWWQNLLSVLFPFRPISNKFKPPQYSLLRLLFYIVRCWLGDNFFSLIIIVNAWENIQFFTIHKEEIFTHTTHTEMWRRKISLVCNISVTMWHNTCHINTLMRWNFRSSL